jgi:hypothetical protein
MRGKVTLRAKIERKRLFRGQRPEWVNNYEVDYGEMINRV